MSFIAAIKKAMSNSSFDGSVKDFLESSRERCVEFIKMTRQNVRTPVLEGDFTVDRDDRFHAVSALTDCGNYWNMPPEHQRWINQGTSFVGSDVLERIAVQISHAKALGPDPDAFENLLEEVDRRNGRFRAEHGLDDDEE